MKTDAIYTSSSYSIMKAADEVSINSDILVWSPVFHMYLTHKKFSIVISFLISQLDINIVKDEKNMDIWSQDDITNKTDDIYTSSPYSIQKTEAKVCIY
jgi:hypothetical protein